MKLPASFPSLQNIGHIFKYGPRIRPMRDWFAIVLGSAVLLGVGLLADLWLFTDVVRDEVPSTAATSTPAIEQAPLEQVHTLFEARAREEARYKDEYHFIDPKSVESTK